MWSLTLPFKEGFATEIEKDNEGQEKEILVNASLKLAYELSLQFLETYGLLPKKPDEVPLSEWAETRFFNELKSVVQKVESSDKKSSGSIVINMPDNLIHSYISFINISGSLASKPLGNRSEKRKQAREDRKMESWNRGLIRIRRARGQKTAAEKLMDVIDTPLPSIDFVGDVKHD